MTDATLIGRPNRQYVPWYRRLLAQRRTVALIVALMLACPFAVRWYRLWSLPDVPVPFDVDAFCQLPALDEENAYFYFGQAANRYTGVQSQQELKTVLDLYRQGARCRRACYIPPQTYCVTTPLTLVQKIRDLQRVAQSESYRLMYAGQETEAADLLHDAVRATRHLGHRAGLIERLVGIACYEMIVPAWHEWSRQPAVTAEDIETALSRLREDWKLTPPVSDSLKAEYFLCVNETKLPLLFFRGEFDQWLDRQATQHWKLSAAPTIARLNQTVPGWQVPVLWTVGEPELTNRAVRLWLRHELEYCDLPFSEHPPLLHTPLELHDAVVAGLGLSATDLYQRLSKTMYLQICPAYSRALGAVRREAGRQTLLETELLLQIRLRRHRAASRADVEQLLADFPWPVDPCSQEANLIQFRAEEQGLVIWSLSLDGTDQQGRPQAQNQPDDLVITIPWPGEQP